MSECSGTDCPTCAAKARRFTEVSGSLRFDLLRPPCTGVFPEQPDYLYRGWPLEMTEMEREYKQACMELQRLEEKARQAR